MNKKVNLLKLHLIKITAIETGEVLDVTSCPTTARAVRRGNGDKLKNPEDICELNTRVIMEAWRSRAPEQFSIGHY